MDKAKKRECIVQNALPQKIIKYRNQDAKDNENHKEPETGSGTYHLLFMLAIYIIIVYNFYKDDYY